MKITDVTFKKCPASFKVVYIKDEELKYCSAYGLSVCYNCTDFLFRRSVQLKKETERLMERRQNER